MISFKVDSNIGVYGGFAGGETLRSQRNYTANVTILSGDIGIPGDSSDNSYHVVDIWAQGSAILDGFTVTGGRADDVVSENPPGGRGGGMLINFSSPTLANVIFSGNWAYYGGGMYKFGTVYIGCFGDPTLTNVTFISNTALSGGGGMYNTYGSPTLTNVTFSNNSAINGGGTYDIGSSSILTNVTFSSNLAEKGGGMYVSSSSLTLTSVAFAANSASNAGGGMLNWNNSNPTILNTIFWGNSAPNGPGLYDITSTPAVSDSVVQGGYTGGTNILTADPLLGALGAWGGSTLTIPLLPGSPAIDAGNALFCPSTDQRSKPRVGTCDIGAFEFQGLTGFTLIKLGGDNQSTLTHSPFGNALAAGLADSGSPVPLPGVVVTFTAPSSGPSAAWSGSPVVTATTNGSGLATVAPPTANGSGGSYAVTATTAGAVAPVTFTLTNLLYDSFLPLIRR